MNDMVTLRARLIGAATAHVVEFTHAAYMPWRAVMPESFNALARACLDHMAEDAGPHTRDALVQAAIGRAIGADPEVDKISATEGLRRLQAAVAAYLAVAPEPIDDAVAQAGAYLSVKLDPIPEGACIPDQRITRRDVAEGRVAPKIIDNGVVAPANGRVNTLTLAEHQARIASIGKRPLTREEAAALGHRADEIAEWFGDAAVRGSGVAS